MMAILHSAKKTPGSLAAGWRQLESQEALVGFGRREIRYI